MSQRTADTYPNPPPPAEEGVRLVLWRQPFSSPAGGAGGRGLEWGVDEGFGR
jgi:hypothetical protein